METNCPHRPRRQRRPCSPPLIPGGRRATSTRCCSSAAAWPTTASAPRSSPPITSSPPSRPRGSLPSRRHLRRHGHVRRLRGLLALAGRRGVRLLGGALPVGGGGGKAGARAGVRPAPPVGGPRCSRRRRAHGRALLAAVRGGPHLWRGVRGARRAAVVDGDALRGLLSVDLGPEDVPSFVAAPDSYRMLLDVVVGQFNGLEDADDVFVNSFHELERKEADYLASTWRFKTIGPMLPSFYLDDDRLPSNKTYGFNLFDSTAPCMAWLDTQPPCSVVYASYGTVADLAPTQLEEIGNGLCNSGKQFLWVVRSVDEHKLLEELRDKCKERGLIVSWCLQLEVLSHKATGCFLTHCGWNSTIEAITTGIPVLAMPQWTDQPTTAKYVESAWLIGVRMHRDKEGVVRKE